MSKQNLLTRKSVNKKMIDDAARIAALAKKEEIAPAQLSNIQEVMFTEGDDKTCFLITAAFALRQASRMKKGFTTARELARVFYEMYKKNLSRECGLVFLGLMRWMYEAMKKGDNINNFEDFLRFVGVRGV